jgi:hypothetical protein
MGLECKMTDYTALVDSQVKKIWLYWRKTQNFIFFERQTYIVYIINRRVAHALS